VEERGREGSSKRGLYSLLMFIREGERRIETVIKRRDDDSDRAYSNSRGGGKSLTN
jgi:hypothetical protein